MSGIVKIMEVQFLDEAEAELLDIPVREQTAISNVVEKLLVNSSQLGWPHSSEVKGADKLRELRPRQGRSPWRPLYRRIGPVFWIAAIAPEAEVDRHEFNRKCRAAEQRLTTIQEKYDAQ